MTDPREGGELDGEIAAMLRREGARVEVPEDAAGRVMERMAASIGGLGGGGGEGGGGGGAGAGAISKVLPFLITFAIGAGVGAMGLYAVTSTPAPSVQSGTGTGTGETRGEAAVVVSAPVATMESVGVDSLPSAVVPRVMDAGEDGFVVERKMLDGARAALARGDHAAAMRGLEEHAKKYGNGRLVEEREALRVRTLADSGRRDEALAAAARFRARWPGSVLLPAVEAAVEGP